MSKNKRPSPFLKHLTKDQLKAAEYKVALASGDLEKAAKLAPKPAPKKEKKPETKPETKPEKKITK